MSDRVSNCPHTVAVACKLPWGHLGRCQHATLTSEVQQIAALTARVAELEKDAARLDWMDSVAFTAYSHRDPFTGTTSHATVVNEDEGRRSGRKGNVGDSIRQAIDKARGLQFADGGSQP